MPSLVGSEMCIRDRAYPAQSLGAWAGSFAYSRIWSTTQSTAVDFSVCRVCHLYVVHLIPADCEESSKTLSSSLSPRFCAPSYDPPLPISSHLSRVHITSLDAVTPTVRRLMLPRAPAGAWCIYRATSRAHPERTVRRAPWPSSWRTTPPEPRSGPSSTGGHWVLGIGYCVLLWYCVRTGNGSS